MFGFEGASLIDETLATNAIYTDATTIESRIADLGSIRDVDGDGTITAMADGLLILRYLFGFRSESLVKDAVAADAVRKNRGGNRGPFIGVDSHGVAHSRREGDGIVEASPQNP